MPCCPKLLLGVLTIRYRLCITFLKLKKKKKIWILKHTDSLDLGYRIMDMLQRKASGKKLMGSKMGKRWRVHVQSRDQCMIATWSVRAQSHDHRLSVTDHCLINTWSVHDEPCDQCLISHVISVCAVTRSVHDSHVISACSVTWSVLDQPRDQCLPSHVIRACGAVWFLPAHLHDNCQLSCVIPVGSSAWQLPAELRDSCLVTCLIIASWAAWFGTAELHAYCLLIAWFVSAQLFEYCLLRSLFGRHLPGISPNWSRVFEGEMA